MNLTDVVTKGVLPAALVFGAFVCAGVMVAMKPSAERRPVTAAAVRVEVVDLVPKERAARLHATGEVRPAQEVVLLPQVSGEVVWMSDQLVPGGRFTKGQPVFRIDARDYDLAVRQEQSRVKQAELELQMEEGRQRIAQREWQLLGAGRPEQSVPLALREPQLETAQQAVQSASSGLQRAKLSLSRTTVDAPFDAVVVEESVSIGQVVGPTTQAVHLVGTDSAWVMVSIPVESIAVVELPSGPRAGSSVQVTQVLGAGQSVQRDGRVLRLVGQLDPATRTATLLIEVDEPYGDGQVLPLLAGAYVNVRIEGRTLSQVYEVPRTAVVDGEAAWVVDPTGRLRRRKLEIGWREDESVLVTDGFETGDRLVTTPPPVPLDGMAVEVVAGQTISSSREGGDHVDG